ncbi:MAG: UDP-N-acetylmuramate dehydrogenase [Bacteroidota bacterium]
MNFISNYPLKSLNTFGIEAYSKLFVNVNSVNQIKELINSFQFKSNPHLIIGGGSNLLLTKNFDGLVIKNEVLGIEVISENENEVYVKSYAGVVWHEFVVWCINNNYAGIENLALIPGCVGASPMQNIGAYGVEIKDIFYELEAVELATGNIKIFTKSDCEFGYRESVFKRTLKNQFIITSVTFQLSKKPTFNINYGAIKQELDLMKVSDLSIKLIAQAIINIRTAKLPNPKEIGNAGSFFKNPEVDENTYQRLKKEYQHLVAYPLENKNYKLAAGWLIEQAGLKGYRLGDAGVHQLQALVLVNYGNATGQEIYKLSTHVLEVVKNKFGITLEREVNII